VEKGNRAQPPENSRQRILALSFARCSDSSAPPETMFPPNRRRCASGICSASAIPIIFRDRAGGENHAGAGADATRVRTLAAYKDFLTPWKDADQDIPILKPKPRTPSCNNVYPVPLRALRGQRFFCLKVYPVFLRAPRG
jgi:hypothetical protein